VFFYSCFFFSFLPTKPLAYILSHISATKILTTLSQVFCFVLFCFVLFYQLSINANGVLAVLSDFMQGLQQTLQGVTVAGWHQVDQQLQGRKLILGLQSYRKENRGLLRELALAAGLYQGR
jgi:hypothetical protein